MCEYEQLAIIKLNDVDAKWLESRFYDIADDLMISGCKILDIDGYGSDVVNMKIKFNRLLSDSIMKILNKNFQNWKIVE